MISPRIGTPRLLPIVIFASVALLGFKGLGLITGSGYVLSGATPAQAEEAAAPAGASAEPPTATDTSAAPSVANAAPRTEPTAADTAPTLADTTPTLIPAPDAADKPAEGDDAEKAAAAGDAGPSPAARPQSSNATANAVEGAGDAPPPGYTVCPADVSMPGGATESGIDAKAAAEAAPKPGTNCDAMAYHVNEAGDATPLLPDDGTAPSATEQTLLARLGQRRTDLDKRESDLEVREATLKAAEQQLQVRTDALKALEAKIQQMDDARKTRNDAEFAAIVKMYETMKPQDAAAIFNGLDMGVLSRVAKAMDPRKMAAVLAKMTSARAQELTAALADPVPGVFDQNGTAAIDPNALPQIVGH
jgi:flagellar motility protein MotE (MotC chaperone)